MAKNQAPVAMLSVTAFAIAVDNIVAAHTLAESIAYAVAWTDELLFGSHGQSSTSRMCAELLHRLAAAMMTHVANKGGTPKLVDLAVGQIQLSCKRLPSFSTYV
jgi:tripartite-type tricarboxylate transporter receptor subunit TctC